MITGEKKREREKRKEMMIKMSWNEIMTKNITKNIKLSIN